MENAILSAMRTLTASIHIICVLGVTMTVFMAADVICDVIRSFKNGK